MGLSGFCFNETYSTNKLYKYKRRQYRINSKFSLRSFIPAKTAATTPGSERKTKKNIKPNNVINKRSIFFLKFHALFSIRILLCRSSSWLEEFNKFDQTAVFHLSFSTLYAQSHPRYTCINARTFRVSVLFSLIPVGFWLIILSNFFFQLHLCRTRGPHSKWNYK